MTGAMEPSEQASVSTERLPQWDMGSAVVSISKEFHFSASHVLNRLPNWHQCARMHGHNYLVVLELSARSDQLTDTGLAERTIPRPARS